MECADDDPDASDPYFFVIDFGCGPTNFRSRRDGLSSNSEAASPLRICFNAGRSSRIYVCEREREEEQDIH